MLDVVIDGLRQSHERWDVGTFPQTVPSKYVQFTICKERCHKDTTNIKKINQKFWYRIMGSTYVGILAYEIIFFKCRKLLIWQDLFLF